MRIDLNADVGESFGAYTIGHDAGLMNVDHVGEHRRRISRRRSVGAARDDPARRRRTASRSARIPGFPDLAGFGRRELHVTPREAEDIILYQIAAVAGVAAAEGVTLQHVKAHGALFNMAARDAELAGCDRARRGRVRPIAGACSPRPARRWSMPRRTLGLRVAARGVRRSRLRSGRPARVAPEGRRPSSTIRDTVVARAVRMVTERAVVASTARCCRSRPTRSASTATRPARIGSRPKIRAGLEAAGVTVESDRTSVIGSDRHRRAQQPVRSTGGTRPTVRARRAFVAASLGWMLDSFDVMLYALVLASLIEDPTLQLSTARPRAFSARSRCCRRPPAASCSASSPIASAASAR